MSDDLILSTSIYSKQSTMLFHYYVFLLVFLYSVIYIYNLLAIRRNAADMCRYMFSIFNAVIPM